MNIVVGEKLTQKELAKRIGISENTFAHNKEMILLELSNVCKYSISKVRRATVYTFTEVTGDYQYKRKNSKDSQKRDELYEQAIIETLQEQPLNTAKNVSRIIRDEWHEFKEFNYTEDTNYRYTADRMKKWFGTSPRDLGTFEDEKDMWERKGEITKKVWCYFDARNNTYVPMSQTALDDFFSLISSAFGDVKKEEISLLGDYDAGTIDKDSFLEQLGNLKYSGYTKAKTAFKEKYKYYPIKVPYYEVYDK